MSAVFPCSQYRRGLPPRQGPLQPLPCGEPWERLSIDITGPHPRSRRGHVYILTVMDGFTKFVEAIPMANQEATSVARALVENVIVRYGAPLQILTDQGTNFEGNLFRELCRLLGIDKVRTSSYHPSCNGLIERFHRTMNAMLGKVNKQPSARLGRRSSSCSCRLSSVAVRSFGLFSELLDVRPGDKSSD